MKVMVFWSSIFFMHFSVVRGEVSTLNLSNLFWSPRTRVPRAYLGLLATRRVLGLKNRGLVRILYLG